MLQLHLNDQQIHCLLRGVPFIRGLTVHREYVCTEVAYSVCAHERVIYSRVSAKIFRHTSTFYFVTFYFVKKNILFLHDIMEC